MAYSSKVIGIYTITCLINNKIYVGYSSNVKSRLNQHLLQLKSNKHSNYYLQKSFNKWGLDNFVFEILEECNLEFLASQENYWCNMLNTHNPKYGYNDRPTHPLNKPTNSVSTKEKLRIANTGKKVSEETKQKLKQINLGKKQSYETIKKRSLSLTGKKRPDSVKLKLSIYRLNNPLCPNLGKKLSKETIEKRSLKRLISINQYDLNMNFIKTWKSLTEAAKNLNLNKSNISMCCTGKRNHVGGFIWKKALIKTK